MTTTNPTIAAFDAGDLTDAQALHALTAELGEVESELAPLEAQRKELRAALDAVVTRLGGKAVANGYAMALTDGGTRVSYDTRALDALLAKLVQNGLLDAAEELAAARRETVVSASLRITKERAR